MLKQAPSASPVRLLSHRLFRVATFAVAFFWSASFALALSDEEIDQRLHEQFGSAYADWPEELKKAFREMERNRPPPRELTPEEIEEAERRAEERAEEAARRRVAEWETRMAEAAPRLRPLIPVGRLHSEDVRQRRDDEFAALREKASASAAEWPTKDRALDQLADRLGIPRVLELADGERLLLTDEIVESPAFITTFNTVASASIGADRLWPQNDPQNDWPFATNHTGLSLAGAGQTLGLWEPFGAARPSHIEFQSRLVQKEGVALDPTGHATQVAGTLAGGGVGLLQIGIPFRQARGPAYQADVFAYTLDNFKFNREAAAAGNQNDPAVFLGNHSWGLANGWSQQTINNQGTIIPNAWVWRGPASSTFPEDPKFGLYTADRLDDTGSTQIDGFHHAAALRHLMVFAAGNDRLVGPGSHPGVYYIPVGQNQYLTDTAVRVWNNGDEGGYDTIAAPGTAKNALTVGAGEDVYHVVDGSVVFGYGPGANAVPASWSAAGPTDDGRIKPELVAVGTPNPDLRIALGQYSLDGQGNPVPLGSITPTGSADNQYSGAARGTSFAAPAVVGGLGLGLERRAQLFPDLTEADAWLGSTLKALAIDTTDDVGAPGPCYRMGHGIFNTVTLVERIEQDHAVGRGSLIKEFALAPTDSVSWTVAAPGDALLSITAAWSDVSGPAPTSITAPDPQDPMLVNNVDLVVEHLDTETIYLPWVLDPDLSNKTAAARSAPATRGVDNRNNVNRVSIASAPAGTYRVTVTHSGGLAGNPPPATQIVSVVLGGVAPEPPKIVELAKSPNLDEFLLTFESDPGAFFTIETSTNLIDWTDAHQVLAESTLNAVLLTSGDDRRFWRLRR